MRKILTSFSLIAASLAFAQVGINADQNDIAGDAVFHVKNKSSEAKGVILPSVSLTGAQDQATITGKTDGKVTKGLLVWNDGEGALKPAGYYYWDGAKWTLTGNVDGGSSAILLGPVKGNIRSVTLPLAKTAWKDDDFTIVVTGTGGISLPDPGGNNAGRIISVKNATAYQKNYADNAPLDNSTIDPQFGHILQSNGMNWYLIGGL